MNSVITSTTTTTTIAQSLECSTIYHLVRPPHAPVYWCFSSCQLAGLSCGNLWANAWQPENPALPLFMSSHAADMFLFELVQDKGHGTLYSSTVLRISKLTKTAKSTEIIICTNMLLISMAVNIVCKCPKYCLIHFALKNI